MFSLRSTQCHLNSIADLYAEESLYDFKCLNRYALWLNHIFTNTNFMFGILRTIGFEV